MSGDIDVKRCKKSSMDPRTIYFIVERAAPGKRLQIEGNVSKGRQPYITLCLFWFLEHYGLPLCFDTLDDAVQYTS
jgi:hypothetical protein